MAKLFKTTRPRLPAARAAVTGRMNLRIKKIDRSLIDAGAAAANLTVSEFMIESARARAAEILPDRRHFMLDAKSWNAFVVALDAPTRPSPRLAKLFNQPSVLDRSDS